MFYELLFLAAISNPIYSPYSENFYSSTTPLNQVSAPLIRDTASMQHNNDAFLVAQSNLSGGWICDDGGTYFVRQVGDQLWWYGQSSDGGESWANVISGGENFGGSVWRR